MTQTEYDDIVIAIAQFNVSLGNKATDLRRQGDPCVYKREENLMALQNILYALRDYDITLEVLTDDEIKQYYELATQIAQSCP